MATASGHALIASLLQHHSSSDWETIRTTESLILEMRSDSNFGKLAKYESLLKTKKFNTLNSLRADIALEEGELIWFNATKSCSVGLDESGSLIWMFDQMRSFHEW